MFDQTTYRYQTILEPVSMLEQMMRLWRGELFPLRTANKHDHRQKQNESLHCLPLRCLQRRWSVAGDHHRGAFVSGGASCWRS